MKNNKHIKSFNEHQENLNISDVSHSLYGKLNIGDTIKWSGEYFDGYDENRNMKNKHQEGINKIINFFIQNNELMMRLDNRKIFSIKNIKTSEELNDGWEKL
jgi:hypothetical protein